MTKKLNNLFNIKNRIVVVTGAAGLLGKNHAEIISAYGGIPILIDINEKEAIKLKKSINEKFKIKAENFTVDITDEKQVSQNADYIKKKYGKIDVLINNASVNPLDFISKKNSKSKEKTRLENFDISNWNKDISVGLTGAFICSKYYGKIISQNKNGGVIVNISSDLGLIAPDQRLYIKGKTPKNNQPVKPVSYSVVKSGLVGLTRYLSTYWADKQVRCNCICPGGIDSGFPKKFVENINLRIPLARMANENEYQGTLIWMISDASKYMNGSIVSVDGGRTAW